MDTTELVKKLQIAVDNVKSRRADLTKKKAEYEAALQETDKAQATVATLRQDLDTMLDEISGVTDRRVRVS